MPTSSFGLPAPWKEPPHHRTISQPPPTTVTPDYTTATSRFTGKIEWVQLDIGDDDHDHFIDPDERFRIAMARQ
jgi:hypothetical protein